MAPDGSRSQRREFVIAWPDKASLRLSAEAGPVRGGFVDVAVRVTNASTFTIGQYYLVVLTPYGSRTVMPACTENGRVPIGPGCEIHRIGPLAAKAQDAFTVTLAVPARPIKVEFMLTPRERYTNADSKTMLIIGGAASLPSARPSASASAAPTLPVTGSRTAMFAGTGGVLVVAGLAMLFLGRRQRAGGID